jgi:hypothetical protein
MQDQQPLSYRELEIKYEATVSTLNATMAARNMTLYQGRVITLKHAECLEELAKLRDACAGIANLDGIAVMRKALWEMSTGSIPSGEVRALATHALNVLRGDSQPQSQA